MSTLNGRKQYADLDALRKVLTQPTPKSVLRQVKLPAAHGRTLTTIAPQWNIKVLNEAFGPGNWHVHHGWPRWNCETPWTEIVGEKITSIVTEIHLVAECVIGEGEEGTLHEIESDAVGECHLAPHDWKHNGAVTSGLSKALFSLGVGQDVLLGEPGILDLEAEADAASPPKGKSKSKARPKKPAKPKAEKGLSPKIVQKVWAEVARICEAMDDAELNALLISAYSGEPEKCKIALLDARRNYEGHLEKKLGHDGYTEAPEDSLKARIKDLENEWKAVQEAAKKQEDEEGGKGDK